MRPFVKVDSNPPTLLFYHIMWQVILPAAQLSSVCSAARLFSSKLCCWNVFVQKKIDERKSSTPTWSDMDLYLWFNPCVLHLKLSLVPSLIFHFGTMFWLYASCSGEAGLPGFWHTLSTMFTMSVMPSNPEGGLSLEFNECNPVLNRAKVWGQECGPPLPGMQ